MKALASLLKLKNLKPSSASHAFRRKLDDNCDKSTIPIDGSPAEVVEKDNTRRQVALQALLLGLTTELSTPGITQTLVSPEFAAPLLKSLRAILSSKETMEALSHRNHTIRSEGNSSAHSLQSLSKLQARLSKDENHPLDQDSKEAMKVLAQLFIDVPCLSLLPVLHPARSATV